MWTSVRWRRPITDAETAQLARVLQLLRGAHGLDPELSLPYGEWEELQGYLGDPTPIPQREDTHTPSPIGYRRRDVQVKLAGGWSVRVPGSFAETWEEDGTYCGWDGKKTVWFTPLHVSERDPPEPAAELLPELDTGERPVQLRGLPAGLLERTGVGELLGERGAVRRLGSRMALPGRLVLLTGRCRPWSRCATRTRQAERPSRSLAAGLGGARPLSALPASLCCRSGLQSASAVPCSRSR
jgi:hypothetical protein